ncbi:MAG: tRNA uridine-5-carboxymethylaminomethyl(34) synthesis GTPase MnmE [Oscillospiraceae bacterium]|nr:tRNA uridine-5-carboxymethylaminomethyl(34) synthesis GTPase MnmE [Oscillospiraceae bacterium]
MNTKTIAAIATPNITASIAVIRLSGHDALEIAAKAFAPVGGGLVSEMAGYTAAYGVIRDSGFKIDDGVLLVFREPKSYTGENVAEITCHGGVFTARRVLQACLSAGAVLAEPGEFTKRAVMNGKMTLTGAESVLDVINSVSEQYLACANAQKSGSLHSRIEQIAERILGVSSHIAAWLDYPDEGIGSFETSSHIGQLTDCRLQLELLLKTYDIARNMREGVVTAIVGKPNAGKSTIMNLLTRSQRSIVTDIPGTTRDVVQETIVLDKAVLRLCDCAGIRETSDEVEQIGIEYMYRTIAEASLVLAVFDNSRPLEKDDYALIERIKGKNAICVINKSDLPCKLDLGLLSTQFDKGQVVEICAKDANSLDALAAIICKAYDLGALDLSAGFVANERQRECITQAHDLLSQAIAGLESGDAPAPLDATAFLLESVLDALYRLSGKSASAEIIDEVFRSFCVGK